MTEHNTEADPAVLSEVPQYVIDHAPLLHLYSADPYRPSSLAAQLTHTQPKIAFNSIPTTTSPLTLDNLDQLNSVGTEGGKNVYLTSNDDITTNPKWLEGILPDANGGIGDEKSCVIVVVDKGAGVVDAFYFYFFAFNWGGVVLTKQLGDHIGDWEHNMIRFIDGVPMYIWLSQHSNGEAYTVATLQKDASNKRPICYIANGSHAVYATPGTHDHTIPNFNLSIPFLLVDNTDAGPLYDPVLSSYIYAYTPATNTFTPLTPNTPTSYLNYTGKWGDEEYPANDARQKGKNLFSFKKYVGGPTGPEDKQLVRKEVWPEGEWSKGQRIRTSLSGVSCWKDAVGRVKGLVKGVGGKRVKRVDVSGQEVGRRAWRMCG